MNCGDMTNMHKKFHDSVGQERDKPSFRFSFQKNCIFKTDLREQWLKLLGIRFTLLNYITHRGVFSTGGPKDLEWKPLIS